MTDKQLKLIYEYMGWLVSSKDGCPQVFESDDCKKHILDSNTAWEVVQEMWRKEDWTHFACFALNDETGMQSEFFDTDCIKWIMNPTNFFNCMAKWLEAKQSSAAINEPCAKSC